MCTLVKKQASFLRLNVLNDLSAMAVRSRQRWTEPDYLIFNMLCELRGLATFT